MYLLRSSGAPRVSLNAFLFGFAAAAVLVAGALSYLASSQPDGLDATTQRGCTVVAEQLEGECIAQRAEEHGLADSPLADYTIGGDAALTGIAGILGVAATFAVLFALVRVLKPSRSRAG
nr:PDGLE domain-containing protein [Nocardia harenae]